MAASMKIMNKLNILNKFRRTSCLSVTKRLYSTPEIEEQSIVSDNEVHYPPIKGKYPPGNWDDFPAVKAAWNLHEKSENLKKITDAKERLEAIAGELPGFFMTKCQANDEREHGLLYKKYITKTHVEKGLPEVYNTLDVQTDLNILKPIISDVILLQDEVRNYYVNSKQNPNRQVMNYTHEYLRRVISTLLSGLSFKHDHLLNSQLDESVRVETFWQRGGFIDDEGNKKHIRGVTAAGIINLQYTDRANWQIRTEKPLPEFVSRDDEMSLGPSVECTYHPSGFGQIQAFHRPLSVSGHWIGDPCEWGHLSFYTPRHKEKPLEDAYGVSVMSNHLHDMAVMAGFGSCSAQAHNQGFSSYIDLTYPITTQVVSYSGSGEFYICAYQLNTLQLYKGDKANPHRNIAWVSGPHRLYDEVEDGQLKGFNNETLGLLIKCFSLTPVDRGYDLRPYLEGDAPVKTRKFINHVGEPVIEHPPIERFQYPRNSVYFQ